MVELMKYLLRNHIAVILIYCCIMESGKYKNVGILIEVAE
jgi:hypothetical protein